MKLSLVVPCYNEEDNIALFCRETMQAFSDSAVNYEIVFVNDGSTDGTLQMLKRVSAGPIPMKIIDFSRNFGKEAAMLAGLEAAEGDYVTVIDADLQQKPSIALEMVKMLEEDESIDCVAAFQEERAEGGILTFFKKSFYAIINRFSDTEFIQGASDFRTFRRPMVDAIIGMKEYYRFSKGLFSWVGFNTKYIPYQAESRAAGESKWSFTKLFKYALDGIESFSIAPLRIPFVLALLFFVISVVLFVVFAIGATEYIVIPVVFFVGSVILDCVGIVGEYLAKTYIQGKDRPVYIIRGTYTNQKK